MCRVGCSYTNGGVKYGLGLGLRLGFVPMWIFSCLSKVQFQQLRCIWVRVSVGVRVRVGVLVRGRVPDVISPSISSCIDRQQS